MFSFSSIFGNLLTPTSTPDPECHLVDPLGQPQAPSNEGADRPGAPGAALHLLLLSQVAVVTGAGHGIGRCLALHLSKLGVPLLLLLRLLLPIQLTLALPLPACLPACLPAQ